MLLYVIPFLHSNGTVFGRVALSSSVFSFWASFFSITFEKDPQDVSKRYFLNLSVGRSSHMPRLRTKMTHKANSNTFINSTLSTSNSTQTKLHGHGTSVKGDQIIQLTIHCLESSLSQQRKRNHSHLPPIYISKQW